MLWERYIFRKGNDVHALWDSLFIGRDLKILYIAGRGFDTRLREVCNQFLNNIRTHKSRVSSANLILLGFDRYELSDELKQLTQENANFLETAFSEFGSVETIAIAGASTSEDDYGLTNALRDGTVQLLSHIDGYTDIILDISSLPRIAYLTIITSILNKLVTKTSANPLIAGGVNFQILVAEDPSMDASIMAEDPENEILSVPGYSAVLHAEYFQQWPCVWFPILGENKCRQLEKVMSSAIPDSAEICPILPTISTDPRRGDRLLLEYANPLFSAAKTPITNVLYAHESHPFEAYRQLLLAMHRYKQSLSVLGGCKLVITPLGSKLITVGAGLAAFDVKPNTTDENYGVAISCPDPRRYSASAELITSSKPCLASLLLTGQAYNLEQPNPTQGC